MRKSISIALAASILLFTGCAFKTGNEQLGAFDKADIEQKIIKSKSTKSDVRTLLGDPNNTDFDAYGFEKWTYKHTRNEVKAASYIPFVNWFAAGTNDTTRTIVVLFDESGVVKNYIDSKAKGETKHGLFQ